MSITATVIDEPAAGWMSQAFSRFSIGRFHCKVEYSGSLGTRLARDMMGDLRVLHLRPLAEQSRRSHGVFRRIELRRRRSPRTTGAPRSPRCRWRSDCGAALGRGRLVAESHEDPARPVARDGGDRRCLLERRVKRGTPQRSWRTGQVALIGDHPLVDGCQPDILQNLETRNIGYLATKRHGETAGNHYGRAGRASTESTHPCILSADHR